MGKGACRFGVRNPLGLPVTGSALGKLTLPRPVSIFSMQIGDNIDLEGWMCKCSINLV